jgi:hypothetical protein
MQTINEILKELIRLAKDRMPCREVLFFGEVDRIDIRLVLLFFPLLLAAIISYHAWCLISDEYADSTIFEHKSLIVKSAFAAAFGKSECVVKPGMVLTSRT